MQTLGDITGKRARLGRDRVALVFGEQRLTYGQLHARTGRLAAALQGQGLQQGDRVAVLAQNSSQYVELMLAVARAGLVLTPLNYRLSGRELGFMLRDSGARLLLADDACWEAAQAIRGVDGAPVPLIAMGAATDADGHFDALIAGAGAAEPDAVVGENEFALLLYTGGTTGQPKGVMLSHRNLLTAFTNIVLQFKFTDQDVTLMVLPMFHVAVWQVICHLMVGACVVIRQRAEVPDILATLERERCTNMNAVPTLYNWIVSAPDLEQYNLSSLRLLAYGGSPFPEEILRRCIARFGAIFAQGYGLTEAAPTVCFLAPEDHVLDGPRARLLRSAGREMQLTEVRVADAEGREVPRGMPGEVLARGANVMLGYWNNEALTRERMVDGWLRTGDIATMDDEGYVFLLDRKADMIVTGGENVYPSEVETVLYQHPAVRECVVTSAPDDTWGERVQAAVVLHQAPSQPSAVPTEQDLLDFCRARLAGYKCPKRIEFWTTLPRTPVGKLLRKDVRHAFWDGAERQIR